MEKFKAICRKPYASWALTFFLADALLRGLINPAVNTPSFGVFRAALAVLTVILWLLRLERVQESIRRTVVSLKRTPQTIALAMLGVAFVYYSFNLTKVSNTTSYIQGSGMGLSAFVIMLFSVLSMVCFLNSFPRRKKTNVPMLALTYLMLLVTLLCNINYGSCIAKANENWRSQYLVQAQRSVAQSKTGAQQAKQDATAAEAYAEEAETLAALAADLQGQIAADEALSADPAKMTAADKALASAQKAAQTAAEQSEKAAAASKTATTDSGKAEKQKTLDTVNSTASSANSAVTQAHNAAEAAKTARDNALAAVNQLEAMLPALSGVEGTAAAPAPQARAIVAVAAEDVKLPAAVITEATAKGEAAAEKTLTDRPYISQAKNMLSVHRVMLLIAVALTALLPVYRPLIRKINTSVEVEANENMGAIELDSSDTNL